MIAASQPQIEFSKQAEEEFATALALYKKAEYKSAASLFDKIARSYGPNQRSSAALIMKAKAELYGGSANEVEKTLQAFFTMYRSSEYVADAHYTEGLLHLKKDEREKALASLLRSLESSASPSLQQDILAALDETIESGVTLATLQEFTADAKQPLEEEYIRIKIAERQIREGEYSDAKTTIEHVKRRFENPVFGERISSLEARLRKPRDLKLGVLLPLMKRNEQVAGRDREIGIALQEGIELALDEHQRARHEGSAIALETRDTERDSTVAATAARELANDPSVVAIIGPAFSNAALAVSTVANERRLPMITPTANANGIAATGEFVFQANPDLETRGKAMAQYAVRNMKLKRLAVLSSNEPSSKTLAEAFANEVKRLGAEIVATEFYPKSAANLTKQLTSLRKKANSAAQEPFLSFNERMTQRELAKLSRLGISMKVLDTLVATRSVVNATDFLGENAKTKLEANGVPFSNGDPRVDSVQRVVTAIQGLYAPIASSSEIGIITSQLAFFSIKTRLLGSGEWNNLAELNANRRYAKSVVFESDSYVDMKSLAYLDFVARFSQRFNKLPTRNTLQGYAVAKLLLRLIDNGATTREEIKAALGRLDFFEALHCTIDLSRNRVNSRLHILEYSNEAIRRVLELNVE